MRVKQSRKHVLGTVKIVGDVCYNVDDLRRFLDGAAAPQDFVMLDDADRKNFHFAVPIVVSDGERQVIILCREYPIFAKD